MTTWSSAHLVAIRYFAANRFHDNDEDDDNDDDGDVCGDDVCVGDHYLFFFQLHFKLGDNLHLDSGLSCCLVVQTVLPVND